MQTQITCINKKAEIPAQAEADEESNQTGVANSTRGNEVGSDWTPKLHSGDANLLLESIKLLHDAMARLSRGAYFNN